MSIQKKRDGSIFCWLQLVKVPRFSIPARPQCHRNYYAPQAEVVSYDRIHEGCSGEVYGDERRERKKKRGRGHQVVPPPLPLQPFPKDRGYVRATRRITWGWCLWWGLRPSTPWLEWDDLAPWEGDTPFLILPLDRNCSTPSTRAPNTSTRYNKHEFQILKTRGFDDEQEVTSCPNMMSLKVISWIWILAPYGGSLLVGNKLVVLCHDTENK